jgi:hypothetical protein
MLPEIIAYKELVQEREANLAAQAPWRIRLPKG